MNYWILPWKTKEFDLYSCLQSDGSLEWRQERKFNIGDVVFIYASLPISQIVFMAKVTTINIPFEESVYGVDRSKYPIAKKPSEFCFRMKLIKEAQIGCKELSYAQLKVYGQKSKLQGPERIRVPSLCDHILDNFDVVFDEETGTYIEGEARRRNITSYERNVLAREKCIKHYGYKCLVCKVDLEEKYGEVGKNFIHVHHKDFISSFKGDKHEIDAVEGLITVCPNCHAMLHRKVNGKYLSPQELSQQIKQ